MEVDDFFEKNNLKKPENYPSNTFMDILMKKPKHVLAEKPVHFLAGPVFQSEFLGRCLS